MEPELLCIRSMGMFSGGDVAIDLGTANTCIYARGAVALNEPSVIAFNTANGVVEAVGAQARDMFGRTPANINPVWPVRGGVIADFGAVEKMLAHFVKKARGRGYSRGRMVIGVPAASTQVERRAVKDSANRMRVKDVCLVDEPMAAAIGAGLPVTEATGSMIVDIGAGTTDIAVVSLAGMVYRKSVRVAGDEMDEAILDHMKKVHSLLIGVRTAEHIKITIGSAAPLDESLTMEVRGRHLTAGLPKSVPVTDAEIREALRPTVDVIIKAVREGLEKVPPELSADIYDRGVVITGGGALLRNLDKRLREDTDLPVQVAEDPLSSVVLGAGRMLSNIGLLKKLAAN